MSLTNEELANEIIANAREDRKRLVDVVDGLKKLTMKRDEDGETLGDGPIDPESALVFCEQISNVTDSLVKVNQQLIEIMKVNVKKTGDQMGESGKKLSEAATEGVYDEIAGETTQ